jgi:hypothetical protein
MKVLGIAHSSERKSMKDNVARWDLSEDNVKKQGIPRELLCGIIVEHNEVPFSAVVKVTVDRGKWRRNRSKSEEVHFDPHSALAECPIMDFEGIPDDLNFLTEKQRQRLAPFSGQYEACYMETWLI